MYLFIKIKKPIIEKKRRDRINNSLEQLKGILLENVIKTDSQISRLDKADILEMTVKYIQQLQKQVNTSTSACEDTISKEYKSGYKECTRETIHNLNSTDGIRNDTTSRVGIHLSSCVGQVNSELSTLKYSRRNSDFPRPVAVPGNYSYHTPLNVDIPSSIKFQSTTSRKLNYNGTLVKPVPIRPVLETESPYSRYYPWTGSNFNMCSTPTDDRSSDRSLGYSSCHDQSFQGHDSSMDRDSLGNSMNNNSITFPNVWRPW
ncbi:hypothetical protein CHS0354_035743 [Potamilus streckersoni]|uniref:Uncharacterized protein n=1 Tax=Potamilus streckersoni TaxID=2493646 RepID=A0AAE0S0P4_9BIVA|nr:hypothetical protein CHS0354_035743 [Potamilus streckersoni]